MKKLIAIIGVFCVVGLIIFTLLSNKAAMQEKAKITPITSFPVSVVTVSKQKLDEKLSQVGVIVANNDVAIVSELQGQAKVTAVLVKEGSYVGVGSPIVKIDDVLPRANYLAAKTSYEKSQKDWERNQSLQKDGLISDSQLESARLAYESAQAQYVAAQRQYQNATITSPISGLITSVPVNIGMIVNPGTVVANVIDNSLFKVKLNIGEEDAFQLRVGDSVVVETDVYPGVKFNGTTSSVSGKGDEAHTYPVQIIIPNNKQYPLKSGMFGKVSFNLKNQIAITIPRDALVGSIKNPQVYVVQDGTAKLRNILVGTTVGTIISVKQGLAEGETVVISGQDNLQDNVEVAIQK
jgi:RND family efflux transporter MFP subunit